MRCGAVRCGAVRCAHTVSVATCSFHLRTPRKDGSQSSARRAHLPLSLYACAVQCSGSVRCRTMFNRRQATVIDPSTAIETEKLLPVRHIPRVCARTHENMRTIAHVRKHVLVLNTTRSTETQTHIQARVCAHADTRTLKRTHTRTHARTHARTHTNTRRGGPARYCRHSSSSAPRSTRRRAMPRQTPTEAPSGR